MRLLVKIAYPVMISGWRFMREGILSWL